MKGRSLLALAVLSLALACEGNQQLTGPNSPVDASKVISDGTRAGGNPDFFFLPPMVSNPVNNPNFERGKFNNAIQPSLSVEICELVSEPLNALPTGDTKCVNDTFTPRRLPLKTFAAGTIRQVGLPKNQTGWWTTHDLPNEGFYHVLWDTRQSSLSTSKYYRIKVILGGSTVLGYADVDPMDNMREFRNARTGDVIPFVDDATLPIPFRVETGAACNGGPCNSATITNTSTTGTQSVTVDGGGGNIAGASFPDGWLPSGDQCPSEGGCPQSVLVTVSEVNTPGSGLPGETEVCHPRLNPKLTQFRGCFHYSTTPTLQPFNEAGDEFAKPVTVAVCYELEGTTDPRRDYAELYASGENEAPHALDDVPEGALVGVTTKDCSSATQVGLRSSNPLVQLASTGWRKLKGGLGQVFGVKTAYAVDLGLGGIVKGFSNISPVLSAGIEASTSTALDLDVGTMTTSTVRIVGSHHHGDHAQTGIGGVTVTFSASGGALNATTVTTAADGTASVNWTMPDAGGVYTLTADGPALGGPVTFTATATVPLVEGLVSFDAPDIGENSRQVVNPYTDAATGIVFSADGGIVGISRNLTSGTSVCVAPRLADGGFGDGDGNQKLGTAPVGGTSIGLSGFPIKATFPTVVPAGTLVSIDVQTAVGVDGMVVEARFLDASGADVEGTSVTVSSGDFAAVQDSRCAGAPGDNKRLTVRLFTTVSHAFKQVVVVGPSGTVFVIDRLQFGAPGSFD